MKKSKYIAIGLAIVSIAFLSFFYYTQKAQKMKIRELGQRLEDNCKGNIPWTIGETGYILIDKRYEIGGDITLE